MIKTQIQLGLVAAFSLALTHSLYAGEIVGYTPFPGINSVAGVAISPLLPGNENNDDVIGTSPNDIWVTQKDYIVNAPVDIVFDVIPSGGVTEYSFREGVQNSTGVDWSGYTIQLGFGTGSGFVPSANLDELDFDDPDYTSPPDFTTFFGSAVTVTEDIIVASGGLHPDGQFSIPYYRFTIDVPDTFSSFTLRQQPIPVPAPSTGILLWMAGLGLAMRRRG